MPAAIKASVVMDRAAALRNDPARTYLSYAVQTPYLQMAWDELRAVFEENDVPMVLEEWAPLTIAAGVTSITSATTPALPTDLIDIHSMHERLYGSSDLYSEMVRKEFLPEAQQVDCLTYYTWQKQEIHFIGATSIRQVKIKGLGETMAAITSDTSDIVVFNSINYLAFRTASLIAMYIDESPSGAESLGAQARDYRDIIINIATKGKQSQPVRRRPFMAAYKIRGGW